MTTDCCMGDDGDMADGKWFCPSSAAAARGEVVDAAVEQRPSTGPPPSSVLKSSASGAVAALLIMKETSLSPNEEGSEMNMSRAKEVVTCYENISSRQQCIRSGKTFQSLPSIALQDDKAYVDIHHDKRPENIGGEDHESKQVLIESSNKNSKEKSPRFLLALDEPSHHLERRNDSKVQPIKNGSSSQKLKNDTQNSLHPIKIPSFVTPTSVPSNTCAELFPSTTWSPRSSSAPKMLAQSSARAHILSALALDDNHQVEKSSLAPGRCPNIHDCSHSDSNVSPRFPHAHSRRTHKHNAHRAREYHRHPSSYSLPPHPSRLDLLQHLRRTQYLTSTGDPEAMYELGKCYYRGLPCGVLRRNKRTGYEWCRRAADGGSARGMAAAGMLLVNGAKCTEEVFVAVTRSSARNQRRSSSSDGGSSDIAKKAATSKSRKRQLHMADENAHAKAGEHAIDLRLPLRLPRDHHRHCHGHSYNSNNNNNNSGEACHLLARAPSMSEGMSLLGLAAASGSALASFWLGRCHFDGRYGLPVNPTRSRLWLSKVVKNQCEVHDLNRRLKKRATAMLAELDDLEMKAASSSSDSSRLKSDEGGLKAMGTMEEDKVEMLDGWGTSGPAFSCSLVSSESGGDEEGKDSKSIEREDTATDCEEGSE